MYSADILKGEKCIALVKSDLFLARYILIDFDKNIATTAAWKDIFLSWPCVFKSAIWIAGHLRNVSNEEYRVIYEIWWALSSTSSRVDKFYQCCTTNITRTLLTLSTDSPPPSCVGKEWKTIVPTLWRLLPMYVKIIPHISNDGSHESVRLLLLPVQQQCMNRDNVF